jgi:hypothetical protein
MGDNLGPNGLSKGCKVFRQSLPGKLIERRDRIRRIHPRRPAAHENGHAEHLLDFVFGGPEFDQRLGMKSDAGVAARRDSQGESDQFLGFLVERAVTEGPGRAVRSACQKTVISMSV